MASSARLAAGTFARERRDAGTLTVAAPRTDRLDGHHPPGHCSAAVVLSEKKSFFFCVAQNDPELHAFARKFTIRAADPGQDDRQFAGLVLCVNGFACFPALQLAVISAKSSTRSRPPSGTPGGSAAAVQALRSKSDAGRFRPWLGTVRSDLRAEIYGVIAGGDAGPDISAVLSLPSSALSICGRQRLVAHLNF
jgi:hypothetical protein